MVVSFPVYCAYPDELPKNTPASTEWIFSRANACLNEDHTTHIAANGECIALQTYFGKTMPLPHPILLVFIHGDGIPGGGPSDYLKFQATKYIAPDVVPVVMIRPGYYDSYGNSSTGESYAFANHGYPEDSYQPHTVDTIAATVNKLKEFYQPHCTILVGHSGGAMMSGVILGKYPKLANGAILASGVGDVHQWAKSHNYGKYVNSLSPDNFVSQIPKNDFIYIVSGSDDHNTYPEMARNYYEQLKQAGITVHWYPQQGGTHNSVVLSDTTAFDDAIKSAIALCQK
jgi:predicted esterase